MTLKKAHNFFEKLIDQTTDKSEKKVYERFSQVISSLISREFSEDEIHSIETELDRLHLDSIPEKKKKYVKKALNNFEKYLKNTFSLTSRNYFTNLGIGLGSSFGILFGIVVLSGFDRSLGIALGLSFGMLIGLIIGKTMDAEAAVNGNVL